MCDVMFMCVYSAPNNFLTSNWMSCELGWLSGIALGYGPDDRGLNPGRS